MGRGSGTGGTRSEGERPTLRAELRSLPVFESSPPAIDYDDLPVLPGELFHRWIRTAIGYGTPEPHAMTLSTVDADGAPDARVLILKDQVDDEWRFASSSRSPKGVQLDARRDAAGRAQRGQGRR